MTEYFLIRTLLASVITLAASEVSTPGTKVGAERMLPTELVFIDADPRALVVAEGPLADGCKWEARAITRIAPFHSTDCIQYFYRTTVTLTRRCPEPDRPQGVLSERTTGTPRFCRGDDGQPPVPRQDARPISTGRTPDGGSQDIVEMPDGTRVILTSNTRTASIRVTYSDRTTDVLQLPPEEKSEATPAAATDPKP